MAHDRRFSDVWHVLYEAGVDVVLNGHEHAYERFAPQDDAGRLDPSRGIREFIVGTGGGDLDTLGRPAPDSEVQNDHTFGVLKLTLDAHAYTWELSPWRGSISTMRVPRHAVQRGDGSGPLRAVQK